MAPIASRWLAGAVLGALVCMGTTASAQTSDTEVNELIGKSASFVVSDPRESQRLARSSLDVAVARYGKDSLEAAHAEYQIAISLLYEEDPYRLEVLTHALHTRKRLEPHNASAIADVAYQIGFYWCNRGILAVNAIPPLKDVIQLSEQSEVVRTQHYSNALSVLANVYEATDQHDLALETIEQLATYALTTHGDHSHDFASTLDRQAILHRKIGNEESATDFQNRAAAIRSTLATPQVSQDDPTYVLVYAYPLYLEGKYQEAEGSIRRTLASRYSTDPAYRDFIYSAKLLLIDVLIARKNFAEAEGFLVKVLSANEKRWVFDHTRYVKTLLAGMRFYEAREQPAKAENFIALIENEYKRIRVPPLEFEGSQVVDYYLRQKHYMQALDWSRRILQPIRDRHVLDLPFGNGRTLTEQKAAKTSIFRHLRVVKEAFLPELQNQPDLLDEAFQIAQLARTSGVGESISKMVARQAKLGDDFAVSLREIQDGYASLSAQQAELQKLLTGDASPEVARLLEAKRSNAVKRRESLQEKERVIAAQYPAYKSLMSRAPLSTHEVASLLRPGEALISYTIDIGATYLSVIRHDNGFFAISLAGQDFLDGEVKRLRIKLVSGETGFAPTPMRPSDGAALYTALLQGLEPALTGVNHIFIVADGPLRSFPFGVIPDGKDPSADWMAKKYAFSYLPSVASLRAVRKLEGGTAGPLAFLGIGDPQLSDSIPAYTLSLASVFGSTPASVRRGLADVSVIRSAPSLPETADELRTVAAALGAPESSLFLRARATESAVKKTNLSQYRIISFATHGVMAGELAEGIEPGLVLTPPEIATEEDDGYLSASEVAALKLNADWVILSACNTAAPNGSLGAEGFSGLANAFLYAGSRALMVSHWRVASLATTDLVSQTMKHYAENPNTSKALALQRAMIELMAHPAYAHPYYWAPFAVVGD